ncbi:MAG TPA: hypothetical protein VF707_19295 [Ardenticatenaceae bacterium]|jgi:hypothetical protein
MNRSQVVLAALIAVGVILTAAMAWDNYRTGANPALMRWSTAYLLFLVGMGIWLIVWVWQSQGGGEAGVSRPLPIPSPRWEWRAGFVALLLLLASLLIQDLRQFQIPLATAAVMLLTFAAWRFRKYH